MKNAFNYCLRLLVKVALFLFYKKIRLVGKEKLPANKAVIIVANHQNALIDPLIIATQTHLKPHFLTRAAAFKHPIVAKLLNFIRMIPVYRVRDGKENMEKNNETFAQSVEILAAHGTILVFAEGGHSHERNLRYPKKGFTRIAFLTQEQYPDLDLVILPIGINYSNHTESGSRVSLWIGEEISVKDFLHQPEALMAKTFQALEPIVTIIPSQNAYALTQALIQQRVDLSNPVDVKSHLVNLKPVNSNNVEQIFFSKKLFHIIHWPLLLIWRSKQASIEDHVFIATFKFIIGLVGSPTMILTFLLVFPLFGLKYLGVLWVLAMIISTISNTSQQA